MALVPVLLWLANLAEPKSDTLLWRRGLTASSAVHWGHWCLCEWWEVIVRVSNGGHKLRHWRWRSSHCEKTSQTCIQCTNSYPIAQAEWWGHPFWLLLHYQTLLQLLLLKLGCTRWAMILISVLIISTVSSTCSSSLWACLMATFSPWNFPEYTIPHAPSPRYCCEIFSTSDRSIFQQGIEFLDLFD